MISLDASSSTTVRHTSTNPFFPPSSSLSLLYTDTDQVSPTRGRKEFDLILQGLYTEPSDQSLWFYHEWLTSLFSSPHSSSSSIQGQVLPNLTIAEKSSRIDQQIQVISEMLDDDDNTTEDCKWIYEALLRYTLIARRLRQCASSSSGSSSDHEDEHRKVHGGQQQQDEVQLRRRWLMQLRKLDPLRNGRWDDLEKSLLSTQ